MTECINVYRATQFIARSLLLCGVRLFITLIYRNGQTLSDFFIAWWPHHSSFPKGRVDCEIPTGSPSTEAPNRGGVAKICDFQPVFQKYRYRIPRYFKIPIPNRHKKIPMKITNTDTDSKYRYRPSSSKK